MPSALKIRILTGRVRSIAWPLTGAFVLLLGFLINAVMISLSPAQENHKTKNVLYINSYHPGYSWSDDIQKGLTEALQSSDPAIELSVEYLDSRRFTSPALQVEQADILQTKYSGYHLDLVVVSDDPSIIEKAFDAKLSGNSMWIDGMMSRKKQTVPNLQKAFGC